MLPIISALLPINLIFLITNFSPELQTIISFNSIGFLTKYEHILKISENALNREDVQYLKRGVSSSS